MIIRAAVTAVKHLSSTSSPSAAAAAAASCLLPASTALMPGPPTFTSATSTAATSGINMLLMKSIVNMRGGAATAAALQNFASEAEGYFGGIRTPASLILGASLGALFTDVNDRDEMKARTRAERECTRLYNSCVLLSFMLSLCTVVFATAAGVTILHGDFNPMAESAYALLMQQFEFEFLTVQLSYLSSLLSFVIGIAGRILLEYKLLHKERREEAIVVCFGLSAVVTHLWSYINSTLYSSQSLVGMAMKLGAIIVQRAVIQHHPLQIVSLACSAIATSFCIHVLFFKKKGKVDDIIL